MNYRHAFHAGNFADVFKHALLTRVLLYMMRKETPLRFIDTHAGVGLYDLRGAEASRTEEWRDGIGRIGPGSHPLLAPWLTAVGQRDAERCPMVYPGSPALAQWLLREQDKLSLCEMHPQDADLLAENIGRDRRVHIVHGDGYAALKALVPPIEKRGLALIDPPFEALDEFQLISAALRQAWGKWPTGAYLVWYPIKGTAAERFCKDMQDCGVKRILRLEIDVGGGGEGLSACGLLVINPPYVLEEEARELLPYFIKLLGRGAGAWTQVEWLAGE